MLSLVTPRAVTRAAVQYRAAAALRSAHSGPAPAGRGPVSAVQLTVNEPGHFRYERDVSRDESFPVPQKQGDTAMRFLTRRLGHAYEVYPLFILTGVWFVLFCYTVYYSFSKMEIWLDRSHKTAPWDWERIRNNYWNTKTLAFDMDGRTHRRIEIMEVLQDQMVEAAKKRGTR